MIYHLIIKVLVIMFGKESINDYILSESIGEGAYGRVYRSIGVDKQIYALKVIQITPKSKQKMRQQGIILASLKHPNILWARQFFYFQQEKYFVIVTEFCNNGSLQDKIQQLPQTVLYPLMIGISEGLKYLHDKNIIHRDIKPQNILLCDWVPKIADMGLAKVVKSIRATTKIGTPFYMAHQMFQSDYDFSADIWALGILFLELSLKKRIFQLLKGQQIPSKRLNFPSQQLLNQIENNRLKTIVSLMLKRQPSQRIKIKQVIQLLKNDQQLDIEKMSINRMTVRTSSRDVVEDCYSKTKDYFYCKYTLKFMKKMYEQNMEDIVTQANNDNKKAIYILAKMYNFGVGMQQNIQKSEQLFMKCYQRQEPLSNYELYLSCTSSNQKYHYLIYGKMLYNDERCLNKLAQNYLEGLQGKDIDYQESYEILIDLVEINYPPAFYLMGKLCSIKNTQFYNIQQSKEYFSKGAYLGQPKCKLKAGQQLLKQKKYKQCLQFCSDYNFQQQLTVKKDLLIFYYLKARCLKKLKNKEAVQYYIKCIQIDDQNKDKDYRGQIAEYYVSVEKYPEAVDFYNEAINRILTFYENMSQYSKKRLQFLCDELYMIYCEQKMLNDAFQIAQVSSGLGHENGKADYAYMIYFGMGTQKNIQLGKRILLNLCKQGNTAAIQYLQLVQRR